MEIFGKNFQVLEKGLDAYTKRAEALADNMANVNTPDYKRKDVQFESFLQKALYEDGTSVIGRRTDEKHFKIGIENKLDNLETTFVEDKNTKMRYDGNNVDIEIEKVEQTKNNIRYQFATNKISGGFTLLKSVIKSR
jgi:flagellar basal-body rod protein FlgB